MKFITLFDTSIATDNLGDEIIMEQVAREVKTLYPSDFIIRVGTHDIIGDSSLAYARKSDVAFVGGTNILGNHWLFHPQWKLKITDFRKIGKPVLMGVGWRRYQPKTDLPTAMLMRYLFSNSRMHSVRDSYTHNRMKEIGVTNVINTGCPTMWRLTPEHCNAIPTKKSPNALITVTAYRNAPELDREWIRIVQSQYEKVYFWPQMYSDAKYIDDVSDGKVTTLNANLAGYDEALDDFNVDYIGTRLHAGIRAIQRGRRALILEVDNRAAEISRDTNLLVVKRDNTRGISEWIERSEPVILTMPWQAISDWKAQFGEVSLMREPVAV